jgi:hypothetical protein
MPHLSDDDPVSDTLGAFAVMRIKSDTEPVLEFPLPNLGTQNQNLNLTKKI